MRIIHTLTRTVLITHPNYNFPTIFHQSWGYMYAHYNTLSQYIRLSVWRFSPKRLAARSRPPGSAHKLSVNLHRAVSADVLSARRLHQRQRLQWHTHTHTKSMNNGVYNNNRNRSPLSQAIMQLIDHSVKRWYVITRCLQIQPNKFPGDFQDAFNKLKIKQNTRCIKPLNIHHGYKHMHIKLCTTLRTKLHKTIKSH